MLVQIYIAAPSYLVLAFVMGRARSRLVQLRYAAHELSRVDPLTGLPNRRAFTERMDSHIGGERANDVTGLMLVTSTTSRRRTLCGDTPAATGCCARSRPPSAWRPGPRTWLRASAGTNSPWWPTGSTWTACVGSPSEHSMPCGRRAHASTRSSPRSTHHGEHRLGALPRYGGECRGADRGRRPPPSRRDGQRQGQRAFARGLAGGTRRLLNSRRRALKRP